MNWLWYLLSAMLGATIGVFGVALVSANREDDDEN